VRDTAHDKAVWMNGGWEVFVLGFTNDVMAATYEADETIVTA
jgi:hypothetical protein